MGDGGLGRPVLKQQLIFIGGEGTDLKSWSAERAGTSHHYQVVSTAVRLGRMGPVPTSGKSH